jgi:hypothetical protein
MTYWDSVLIVVAAAIAVVVLFKRGEVSFLKEILFRLVTKAEQEFGCGTGELKKAAVVEWIYDKLPAILRFIITRKEIDNLIDEIVVYAKTKWAANAKLKEYVSGETTTST